MASWAQVFFRRGGVEVALDECTFQLPLHVRGVVPPLVTVRQGGQRFDDFDALYRAEGELEIETQTPDEYGQMMPSIVKNWDIKKVQPGPGDSCEIQLIEARRELQWHTCTQDINLKRWTGYVPGTAGYEPGGGQPGDSGAISTPWNLREGLRALAELPPLAGKMLDGWQDAVPDVPVRDDIFIGGLNMDAAIEVVEQATGLDIVLDPSTRLYTFKPRQDVSGSLSGDWNGMSWRIRPGWLDRPALISGLPAKLTTVYRRRVTLHAQNRDAFDTSTATANDQQLSDLPGVPKVVFDEVYDFAGKWMTLADMLEAAGYPRNAITPVGIAAVIMEDNWQDTALFFGRRPSSVTKGVDAIVRKAIKDGWRRYYAIRFLNKEGKDLWGGYSEIKLGELNLGGGFRAGQVFVDWTEILPKAEEDLTVLNLKQYRVVLDHEQGVDYPTDPRDIVPFKWTGYDGTRYRTFTASPFKLEWKDQDHGIVWLKADTDRIRGSTAFVGRPTKGSLKALSRGVSKTNKNNELDLREVQDAQIDALPTEAKRSLQFEPQYRLDAYISAILESPQGPDGIGKRFYDLSTEGLPGDIPEVRLPVPDSPEAIHGAGDTIDTEPSNFGELGADHDRRVLDLFEELGARAQGPGETLDVHLVVPRDMDKEMIGSELHVNENVITVVVAMGNEGNPSARRRVAAKREAGRVYRLAGKESR